ncbi:hypothetical protein [Microbacterium galbinum]|uniref:Uncharacterized protein n=1 Tax=Microbacterium galbinum TaxID=2851646 RepID=A0ABY4IV57_9MICO|nr:hypothetical protein [Microbacterium galbinum]UPL15686.1 hypothetical protein KV396_14890 [Microbacterium galbinum]
MLEHVGFVGIVPFAETKTSVAPSTPGLYAVLRDSGLVPEMTESTTSSPLQPLQKRWVDGASIVYIGKAGISAAGSCDT